MFKFFLSVAIVFRALNFFRDVLTTAVYGIQNNFGMVLVSNNVGGLGYCYRRKNTELIFLIFIFFMMYAVDYKNFNRSLIWYDENYSIILGLAITLIVFFTCKNLPINELKSKRKNIFIIELIIFLCSTLAIALTIYRDNILFSIFSTVLFILLLIIKNGNINIKKILNKEFLKIFILVCILYILTIREIYEINRREDVIDTFFWLARAKLILLTFIIIPLFKDNFFYNKKNGNILVRKFEKQDFNYFIKILFCIIFLLILSFYTKKIESFPIIILTICAGLLSLLSSLGSAIYMPFLVKIRKSHILVPAYAFSCSWILIPDDFVYNLFLISAVKDALLLCASIFIITFRRKLNLC